jgi:HK97 family phage portal protein
VLDLARRLFTTKASATTRLDIQPVTGAQAVWTNRNYKDLAREGYESAVWVYACIRALTTQTSYVRPILYQQRRGGAMEELDTHPLLDLISRPNDEQALERFLENAYATFLVSGNAYIERVGLENRPPVELYVKRPDRMKVNPGNAAQRIGGYTYEIGGQTYRFQPWEILHLKTWSPLDDWYGLSPLAAAARGVDTFNAGQAHNLALLQNGARPSGAWVNNSTMTDDQFRRLREQIDDATRTNNRGRPILLEGGISWQELGVNPRDLDFLAGQEDAARQIHAAYGVHPVLTGLQTGTFENQREAIRNLVTLSVFPFLDMLFGELTRWIAPAYGEGLRLSFDRNAFPAFTDDESELLERARGAYKDGILTLNEARAMAGYDETPDGDQFGRAPTSTFEFSANPPLSTAGVIHTPEVIHKGVIHKDRTVDEYLVWKARDAARQVWEERMERVTRQIFTTQRERLAAALSTSTPDTMELAVDNSITADDWQPLRELWLATMLDGGQMTLDELNFQRSRSTLQPNDFSIFRQIFGLVYEQAIEYAANHTANLVVLVNDTTKASIRGILGEGFTAGSSVDNMARQIDDLYLDQIIPNRSRVIARTESIRAANRGSLDAAKGTGLDILKRWVATFDGRAREEHEAANGTKVPADSPFEVWGENLMHPGDPSGSAANTIQCRCTMTYERRRP